MTHLTTTLYNGCCLKIMKTFKDKRVDAIITSPPYNMRLRVRAGEYTVRENTKHFSKKYTDFDDAMPITDFFKFHYLSLKEMLRVSKVVLYNFQVVTGSKEAFFRLIGEFSKEIKDIIIWDKGFGQPAMHDKVLNSAFEVILILEDDSKKGRLVSSATFKRGKMQNILRIKRERAAIKGHGAVFPIELATTLIKNFSKEGSIILDPFMGSGTTGVACINTGRHFIGIELMKEYYDLASKRLFNHEPTVGVL